MLIVTVVLGDWGGAATLGELVDFRSTSSRETQVFFGVTGCSLPPIWTASLGIFDQKIVEMIETGQLYYWCIRDRYSGLW